MGDLLWEAQTPQGFHKDVLVKACARKFKEEATDDAMMVERIGYKGQDDHGVLPQYQGHDPGRYCFSKTIAILRALPTRGHGFSRVPKLYYCKLDALHAAESGRPSRLPKAREASRSGGPCRGRWAAPWPHDRPKPMEPSSLRATLASSTVSPSFHGSIRHHRRY